MITIKVYWYSKIYWFNKISAHTIFPKWTLNGHFCRQKFPKWTDSFSLNRHKNPWFIKCQNDDQIFPWKLWFWYFFPDMTLCMNYILLRFYVNTERNKTTGIDFVIVKLIVMDISNQPWLFDFTPIIVTSLVIALEHYAVW